MHGPSPFLKTAQRRTHRIPGAVAFPDGCRPCPCRTGWRPAGPVGSRPVGASVTGDSGPMVTTGSCLFCTQEFRVRIPVGPLGVLGATSPVETPLPSVAHRTERPLAEREARGSTPRRGAVWRLRGRVRTPPPTPGRPGPTGRGTAFRMRVVGVRIPGTVRDTGRVDRDGKGAWLLTRGRGTPDAGSSPAPSARIKEGWQNRYCARFENGGQGRTCGGSNPSPSAGSIPAVRARPDGHRPLKPE